VDKKRATTILGKASRHGSKILCPYARGSLESRLWNTRLKFNKVPRDTLLQAFIKRGMIDE